MAGETVAADTVVGNSGGEHKTLFVKNLPEDATKEQLELVFSEVGRLRHCFVVKKRRTDNFRGIGFVTFVDATSADAALKRSFKLGNCQLGVSIAEDKKKIDPAAKPNPKISFTKEAKKARQLQKAKLIVRNLSFKATEADLQKCFGKYGKVAGVTIPKKDDGKVRGFAFVQFEKLPEAAKAVQALNAKAILGRPVAVDFAVAKGKFEEVRKSKKTEAKSGQKDAKKQSKEGEAADSDDTSAENHLKGVSDGNGQKATESTTGKRTAGGKRNDGKRKPDRNGKAKSPDAGDDCESDSSHDSEEGSDSDDEQSSSGDDAEKPKHKHLVKKKKDRDNDDEDEDEGDEVGLKEESESDSEVEFGSDGEVRLVKANEVEDKSRILKKTKPPVAAVSRKGKMGKIGKPATSSASEDEDDSDDSSAEQVMDASEGSEDSDDEAESDTMDVDQDESSSDDEEEEQSPGNKDKPGSLKGKVQKDNKGSKGQNKVKQQSKKHEEDSDSDWGHTPNDDSSEDDEADTEDGRDKAKRKREMIEKEDLSRTVFVKNISFDTTQTTFQEHMKKFGSYKFCLICMDKMLERSKGTGFVKFEERADAARCVESLQAGEVTLDGKVLSGSIAMKRDQLQQEIQKKMDSKKQPKDKRNLYLAREGFIRGGTSAGAQVSDHDLKVRTKLEANKKKALKNLHNFVSSTRLCIHNLPHTCDDKQLRKIFGRVVDRTAKITEARVMRNMQRLGTDGKAVSKGFGFVNFERHEDALKALRAVNNNPDVFTDQMRPIVSFSIENKAALMVKERRLKNSREKLQEINQMKRGGQGGASEDGDIDYRQGRRQSFEGLRAQVDMKDLPKRVGEKVRLDPKRRQHQMQLKRLARQAKRKPEFKKPKGKKLRGPTKAQLKERRNEKGLNQMIEHHRQKMRRQVMVD